MKIPLGIILASTAFAQAIPVGLSVPEFLTLQVNLAGAASGNPASLYADIAIPVGFSLSKTEPLVSNSTTSCKATPGTIRCVVIGFFGAPVSGLPGRYTSRLPAGGVLRLVLQRTDMTACRPVAKLRLAQGAAPDASSMDLSWRDVAVPLDPSPAPDLNVDGQVNTADLDIAIRRLLAGVNSSLKQVMGAALAIGSGDCPLP